MREGTMTAASAPAADVVAKEAERAPRRRRTPFLVGSACLAAIAVAGVWHVARAGRESTDDAQVEGRVMSVSARVPGQVLHVRVTDNQRVSAGDVILELDPADYAAKVAVARADLAATRASADAARAALELTRKTAPANLAQARGGWTSAASSVAASRAAIEQGKADVLAAESRRTLAETEWRRTSALVRDKAVPDAELDTRRTELDSARAALDASRARLVSANAALDGSSGGVELARGRLTAAQTESEQIAAAQAAADLADARVAQMQSALAIAELNLSYTTIRATRGGVVSRRSVEEGQIVSPERALLAIVPLDDVWIVANFKEDQLGAMAVGSPAEIETDTYAGKSLHGHVDSIAGGTGARFALLPPDNATGNFVKVVQRVPVLIRIDDAAGLALRPGMSADVTVETRPR
jgi:membrane fusion protein, multidrug efflux system